MLVLTRKWDEGLFIGEFYVKALRFDGNKVVLGIDAPRGVHIVREELLSPEEAANRRARAGQAQALPVLTQA